MKFTGKVYDILKWIAQVVLPATGTAYYGLAVLWHFPNAEQVSGTILILDTLLGTALMISTRSYNKTDKYDGTIDVQTTPEGKKVFQLNVGGDLDKLDQKEEIWFKVNPISS